MITQMKWGAMYGQLEPGDTIETSAIMLDGHILLPGAKLTQIGSKKRSMFSMQDGYSLVYRGMCDEHLLFTSEPTGCDGSPWYYAFAYIDPMTLLQGSAKGCRDIIADKVVFV